MKTITQKVNKKYYKTNNLLKAVSIYVAEKLGLRKTQNEGQKTDPWWKRRIEKDINTLRKDIGPLERKKRGELRSKGKCIILERKYKIKVKGNVTVIEEL